MYSYFLKDKHIVTLVLHQRTGKEALQFYSAELSFISMWPTKG